MLIGRFAAHSDENAVMTGFRQLRNLLMLKWIWQDALGVIELEKLMEELSEFTNACICYAKNHVYDRLVERYGVPMTVVEGENR